MPKQGRFGDICPRGDLFGGGGAVAAVSEQFVGRFEEARPTPSPSGAMTRSLRVGFAGMDPSVLGDRAGWAVAAPERGGELARPGLGLSAAPVAAEGGFIAACSRPDGRACGVLVVGSPAARWCRR